MACSLTRYTGTSAKPLASSMARTFSLMKSTPRTTMVRTPARAMSTARSAIASESEI